MVGYIDHNWIAFYVECFDRMLFVWVPSGDIEEAEKILTQRYETWLENEIEEVHYVCCEEYMVNGLEEKGIECDVQYGVSKNEE